MKNRINFLMTLAIMLSVSMTISSCGGSSSGLLGDLPNIVAEMRAEEESYKEEAEGITSMEDFAELAAEAKETEKEYEAEIAEISTGLMGTTIPFEVAEGLPYKIASDIKIDNIPTTGDYVRYAVPIITTADVSIDGGRTGMEQYYIVYMVCVDADGNHLSHRERKLKSLSAIYKEVNAYKPGVTGEVECYHYISDRKSTPEEIIKAGTIAKIKFINKEEFDKL